MIEVRQLTKLVRLIDSDNQVSCYQFGGPSDEKAPNHEVRELVSKFHKDLERKSKDEFESVEPAGYKKMVVAGLL